jgi:hypothetical protein
MRNKSTGNFTLRAAAAIAVLALTAAACSSPKDTPLGNAEATPSAAAQTTYRDPSLAGLRVSPDAPDVEPIETD